MNALVKITGAGGEDDFVGYGFRPVHVPVWDIVTGSIHISGSALGTRLQP